LIGLDFSFNVPKPTGEVCVHGEVLVNKSEVNHFIPGYRNAGEKWTMPRMDMQYRAFECAKRTFENHGGKIYNASRKTALDLFPLVNFDDVMAGKP
jgi:hypothetical protein